MRIRGDVALPQIGKCFFFQKRAIERERERWRTHADDDDAGRLDAVDAVGRLAPVEAHVVRVHVRNA